MLARMVYAEVLWLFFEIIQYVLFCRLNVHVTSVEVNLLFFLCKGLLKLLELLAHALIRASDSSLVAVVVLVDKDARPELIC
jgi:hypothetical protein